MTILLFVGVWLVLVAVILLFFHGAQRPRGGVRVIQTRGLPKGYVPPSASLRGQDMLDRTPVPPKPLEEASHPVVVQDVND